MYHFSPSGKRGIGRYYSLRPYLRQDRVHHVQGVL